MLARAGWLACWAGVATKTGAAAVVARCGDSGAVAAVMTLAAGCAALVEAVL